MTRIRNSILAAVIAAVTALASGCGGSAAKPHTPGHPPSAAPSPGTANGVPAEPPPAGYKWVGSASQGVWFAVPRTWVAVNLAKISASQAISSFAPKGLSGSYLKSLLSVLSQRHAIFVADLASAVRSPHHFATNGNAFCAQTALTPGAGSTSALVSAIRAEYAKIRAQVLAIRSATIDGDPGVRSELRILSNSGVTITEAQYVVLTKKSNLCTITLSTDTPTAFRRTFDKIGGAIRVS
jgi:hypothetical protein